MLEIFKLNNKAKYYKSLNCINKDLTLLWKNEEMNQSITLQFL